MKATGAPDEHWLLDLSLLQLRVGLIGLRRDLQRRWVRSPTPKYRPDQPRVPAGTAEGGQWTDGSGGSGPMSFEEWLAGGWAEGLGAVDAEDGLGDWRLRDDQAPIEEVQYRPRGGGGGCWPDATPGQQTRLAATESQAQAAIRRVQEIDPRWQPPASMSEGIEGAILSSQAAIRQADARLPELASKGIGEGPFAQESIPARGPGRNFTASERREINRIGSLFGCHTCGTTEPGTKTGNFILDHQTPNALWLPGSSQRLYPQCLSCNHAQGGHVRSLGRIR